MLDQVLAPLDQEMARIVEGYVERHGIRLALNDGVAGFKQTANGSLEVLTKSGKVYPADIVILALGVRPDTALAKTAGLEIGERGGIRVDEHMRTSNPDIFAVGDAIEVKDFVTGQWSLIALAGPANRQGRIAADVIAGRDSRFRGTQGTSIIGLFGAAAAWTGASEKTLNRIGDKDFEKIYLYPNSHAGYYPGARPLAMKVLFRKSDGRLLGAQALGLRMAWTSGSAHWPWRSRWAQRSTTWRNPSSATRPSSEAQRIPVNFAGMVAADVLRGDMPISHWDASRQSISARRARASGAGRGEACRVRSTSRWVSSGRVLNELPRDREIHGHLPLRRARVLRDAHPAAERVQGRKLSGGMLSRAHATTFWES